MLLHITLPPLVGERQLVEACSETSRERGNTLKVSLIYDGILD